MWHWSHETDDIFKVMGSEVEVTDMHFSGGGIQHWLQFAVEHHVVFDV